jgi:hypothetical protein
MDETDVEILWTMKQTESHYLKEIDIRKNNVKLTSNDELEARLRYLAEGGLIESVPAVFGSGYMLKKPGNDLFWSSKLRNRILNFLYVCDYSLKELTRLLCSNLDDISATIQHLQNESPSLVEKRNVASDGIIYYSISSSGEFLSHPNFADMRSTNTESFSQIRIGQIDIQGFETKMSELILQVEKEPNLSKEQTKMLKEKLINLKNMWIETRKYGKEISPLLTLKGFDELFPKSLV